MDVRRGKWVEWRYTFHKIDSEGKRVAVGGRDKAERGVSGKDLNLP